MGQQQLLLLVLSVVLVGVAVVVGVDAFLESQVRNRQEMRMDRLATVAVRVQAWARTPAALGGGAGPTATNWPGFRLESVGLDGERLSEIHWRFGAPTDPLGCFALFVNVQSDAGFGSLVHLHLLDPDCSFDSWRQNPALVLSGPNLDDITWKYPPF